MDSTHFHLAANHIPVILIAVGICILAAGMLMRKEDLKKTALVIFFAAGLVTIPVYLTGEGAEERVEHLPGVSESIIESHEDAAKPAMIAALILGALAFAGLVSARWPKAYKGVIICALGMSLVAEALMFRAAALGGQIRHTEIRPSGEA